MYLFSFCYFSLYEKKLWTRYVRIKIQVLLWLRSLSMRLILFPFLFFISIHDTLLIRKELPAFAHLKGASIFLMYDCPKRLPFIPTMGLKVHPHFQNVWPHEYAYIQCCWGSCRSPSASIVTSPWEANKHYELASQYILTICPCGYLLV